MSKAVNKIVIVGGGTAGWLTAAIIAAQHKTDDNKGLQILLVESSDIPTVGVGEGTWPTMKNTLQQIGLKESDVFARCHAGFKQGGKFVDWVHGNGDFYYHPFTVPLGYGRIDLAPYVDNIENYAVESNFQHHVCEAGLAPRSMAEGEYKGQCNYAYHLDAGEFAEVLKEHCKNNLNVSQIIGTVASVNLTPEGAIGSILLSNQQQIDGDLFVDCTGFSSLLLGQALEVPFISADKVLFNDSALALHMPYESGTSPIASHTIATGQNAGWIWDIGLTHRRGVGHVYSSQYLSDDEAEANLRRYLGPTSDDISVRKIGFKSGHRAQVWKQNCVAVGMSAGFVEPLEATAIMLVEISARFIADNIPPDASLTPIIAKRFNQQMAYRWSRIIDFLKLHYMLTKRPEPYWQAHTDPDSIPDSLKEDLALWKFRGPISADFDAAIELFPAASYQYVLYGMGFKPDFSRQAHLYNQQQNAQKVMLRNQQLTQQLLETLPPHREYIERWLSTQSMR
ncbi:tryptophan halogenase family protein [Paraglaciecola chathamensis]|uniref:tryptophan halogenase family protein n=1 Tax=Paraglaciecola chathamensis TaxID=368405 RepID=UPI0027059FA2|nr:tryptophan halogenase family protein [Paraglaciecola chathamensis]MDO6559289.1 tryptophan 7-halogenase [Paraglaciecola chathamensis]